MPTCSSNTLHEWERDGKRYRAVYDDLHETRGSYAYDTPEETKAADDTEIANLESGKWIVIGILTYEFKSEPHCSTCKCNVHPTWHEVDSLWGIVVDNNAKAWERFAAESM